MQLRVSFQNKSVEIKSLSLVLHLHFLFVSAISTEEHTSILDINIYIFLGKNGKCKSVLKCVLKLLSVEMAF